MLYQVQRVVHIFRIQVAKWCYSILKVSSTIAHCLIWQATCWLCTVAYVYGGVIWSQNMQANTNRGFTHSTFPTKKKNKARKIFYPESNPSLCLRMHSCTLTILQYCTGLATVQIVHGAKHWSEWQWVFCWRYPTYSVIWLSWWNFHTLRESLVM